MMAQGVDNSDGASRPAPFQITRSSPDLILLSWASSRRSRNSCYGGPAYLYIRLGLRLPQRFLLGDFIHGEMPHAIPDTSSGPTNMKLINNVPRQLSTSHA